MAPTNILKINIAVNLIKIISLWGASILFTTKVTMLYLDAKSDYHNLKTDVSELKVDMKGVQEWQSQNQSAMNFYKGLKNKNAGTN